MTPHPCRSFGCEPELETGIPFRVTEMTATPVPFTTFQA
jgi:hypothetical protein